MRYFRTGLGRGAIFPFGGAGSQPAPELFGYISHADFDGDGHLVLLDAAAQEIRRFDPNGQFIDGFGGRGDGPLEMRRASWFTFLPGKRIAVVLGETGQIKVFHRSDGAWVLDEIVHAEGSVLHLCSMGNGRLFVSSLHSESNIIASELGDAVRSFGEGYRHNHSFLRSALSEGFVACIPDPARLVFAFDVLPVIRSYVASTGRLIWDARVNGHLQLEIAELVHPETGAPGYSRREQVDHDRVGTLAATPDGDHILVQYEPHPRLEVRSFHANRESTPP